MLNEFNKTDTFFIIPWAYIPSKILGNVMDWNRKSSKYLGFWVWRNIKYLSDQSANILQGIDTLACISFKLGWAP